MKVTLLFPPPVEVTQPYLALPALTAYLRSNGFDDVEQDDLGIGAFDHLASFDYLRAALDKVQRDLSELDGRASLEAASILRYDALFRASAAASHLPDEIESTKRFFRTNAAGTSMKEYRWHADRIHAALRLISAAHYPTEWNAHLFTMRRSRRLPGPVLLELARAETDNPFLAYFRRRASGIVARNPALLGISVAFSNQLIPALTIAAALREAGYHGFIVLGGAFISHCALKLPSAPELFRVVDGFVPFGGEIPLLRLTEALRDHTSLDAVPGLMYRTPWGEIRSTPVAAPPPLSELPIPDFRGLDLGLYLSPQPLLPLLTSRGCYFNRCTFCSHTWSYEGRYETLSAERVVDAVESQTERHGAAHFYFVDECLAPASVRRIARRLLERRLDIQWMADVRYEAAFTPELLDLAHRSGCRLLAFGLESANNRVLKLMRKGTTREISQSVLDNCHKSGIASNVMFFIGFPTETAEEAWETLEFILENRRKIDMVSLGTFQFNKNARMMDIAQLAGLEFRQALPQFELTDFHRYHVASGMQELEASKLEEVFLRRLQSEGYDYPLLSRTHALIVDRGLFGFSGRQDAGRSKDCNRPLPAREFEAVRRRYRVRDIRSAAAQIREHLRREALQNLREADEALGDCNVNVQPRDSVVLTGRDMTDWAVDVSEADLVLIGSISDPDSLNRLSSDPRRLECLLRLLRLERLGVLRWQPEEAAEAS
jgi:hypothetical protein